jgi:hypothetical protein
VAVLIPARVAAFLAVLTIALALISGARRHSSSGSSSPLGAGMLSP